MLWELDLLTSAIADCHEHWDTDPSRDIALIHKLSERGLAAVCSFCKDREDEILMAMSKKTTLSVGFLSLCPHDSLPSARACCAILSKYDPGLAERQIQKLWTNAWSAKAATENRLRGLPRSPRIASYLEQFSARFMRHLESDTPEHRLLPHFSSGAVAERFSAKDKYLSRTWGFDIHELDSSFRVPSGDTVVSSSNTTARFFCVPKDANKLRPISIEPAHRIYMQHACRRELLAFVDSTFCLRTGIPYRDQSINADLSRDLSMATIDLSNASDSVRCCHVYSLFSSWKAMRRLLLSTRSSYMQYGDETIRLASYAGMGNATTFMVESLVFFAISYMALDDISRDRRYRASAKAAMTTLRVYGDDIVVDSVYAATVIDALREAGFQPNVTKTFITGPFRESCGAEWYNAIDARVPRLRAPGRESSSVPFESLVSRLRYWGFRRANLVVYNQLVADPWAQTLLFGRSDRDLIFRWDADKQNALVKSRTPLQKASRLSGAFGVHAWLSERCANISDGKPVSSIGWLNAYATVPLKDHA